jgi:ribosomal protein L32
VRWSKETEKPAESSSDDTKIARANKPRKAAGPASPNRNGSNKGDKVKAAAAMFVGRTNVTGVESAFSFRCPHHVCDTCDAHYAKDKTIANTLFKCVHCPRAFHENCVPPGSRFNSLLLICPLHPECPLPSDKLTKLSFAPSAGEISAAEAKDSKFSHQSYLQNVAFMQANFQAKMSKSFNLFWEQMSLPDTCPAADNVLDNHFCLPVNFKETKDDEPKHFKQINKLCYDCLPEKEKSTPLHSSASTGDEDVCCDCVYRCDARCFNRLLSVECDDRVCNVLKNRKAGIVDAADPEGGLDDSNCGNRNFTHRIWARTQRIREDGMGFGLKSAEYIPKGTLVTEYIGEVIDGNMMRERFALQRLHSPSDKDYYVMQLGMYLSSVLCSQNNIILLCLIRAKFLC